MKENKYYICLMLCYLFAEDSSFVFVRNAEEEKISVYNTPKLDFSLPSNDASLFFTND